MEVLCTKRRGKQRFSRRNRIELKDLMANEEKIIQHLLSTLERLKPEYVRKVMVYADILYKIQEENNERNSCNSR